MFQNAGEVVGSRRAAKAVKNPPSLKATRLPRVARRSSTAKTAIAIGGPSLRMGRRFLTGNVPARDPATLVAATANDVLTAVSPATKPESASCRPETPTATRAFSLGTRAVSARTASPRRWQREVDDGHAAWAVNEQRKFDRTRPIQYQCVRFTLNAVRLAVVRCNTFKVRNSRVTHRWRAEMLFTLPPCAAHDASSLVGSFSSSRSRRSQGETPVHHISNRRDGVWSPVLAIC